jgi:hypothetical protein
MLDVEAILRPYFERLCEDVGGIELFDAHTHIGANDPDGFRQTPAELLAALDRALVLWADRDAWRATQLRAMAQDHSWGRAAEQYEALYKG